MNTTFCSSQSVLVIVRSTLSVEQLRQHIQTVSDKIHKILDPFSSVYHSVYLITVVHRGIDVVLFGIDWCGLKMIQKANFKYRKQDSIY